MRDSLKYRFEYIISLMISIIVSGIFLFNSPLHPWIRKEPGIDSSVFKTVSLMMREGYLPYKDSFDHKGPLLYFINFWGDCLSKEYGVLFFELLSLSVTVFVMFRIARLFCKSFPSAMAVFVALSLLFNYFEGGNFTEEYAMPFIAVSLLYFISYMKDQTIPNWKVVVSGICLGAVLMLRPNMISVWIVFCIAITVMQIKNQDINKLIRFILLFLLGVVISVLPILIWLLAKGIFGDFFDAYLIFNFLYSDNVSGDKWWAFFTFFETPVFVFSFFTLVVFAKKNWLNSCYIIYLITTIVLMVMSGVPYAHYGMVLIPGLVYPISLLFHNVEILGDEKTRCVISNLLAVYILSVYIVSNWIGIVRNIPQIYNDRNSNHMSAVTTEVTGMIRGLTDEEDTISVYGNWNALYVLCDRRHATKYSFQFPIGGVNPAIMDEYWNELQEELPPIIVVSSGYYNDGIKDFLTNNDYEMRYAENLTDYEHGVVVYALMNKLKPFQNPWI